MAFRDSSAPHITIEHSGVDLSYQIADVEGVLQWFPTFLDEIPPEQFSAPSPFSYNNAPKPVQQVLAFEGWGAGAGYVDAPSGTTSFEGYSYSRGVDASDGRLILSPQQQTFDGTSVSVDGYYVSPTWGVYALVDTTLYQLSAGEWVLRYTGAASLTDLKEYGNSTDVYLFLTMGDSTDMVYSTDGFTTAPTTVTGEKCSYLAIRGNSSVQPVLIGVTASGLLRTSTNPIASANWSNADRIGSAGETVTAVVVANDLVWIFKEEGYYTFDGTNVGAQVPVDQLKQTGNGKYAHVWINGHIYVNYANRLLDIDPFNNSTATLLSFAHPEINGSIKGITSDLRNLYVVAQNQDSNAYVLKIDPSTGVTHTFMYLGAATINAITLSRATANNVSTTNDALLFNTSTATSSYALMPRAGYRPWEDSNYRFDYSGTSFIVGSNVDVGAATFPKFLNGGRVLAESVTGARNIVLAYDIDNLDSYTTLVTAVADGLTEAQVSTSVSFNRIRYKATLSTGDANHTPRGVALMLSATPNPPRYRLWRLGLDVADLQRPYIGGEARPVSYEAALNHIFSGVGKRITYTDYFGDAFTVKMLNASVEGVKHKVTGTARTNAASMVTVILAEINTDTTIGTPGIWDQSLWDSEAVWT